MLRLLEGGLKKPTVRGWLGEKFINVFPELTPCRADGIPIIPFPIYSILRRFPPLLSFQDLSTMELNMLSLLYFLLLLSLPSMGLYMYLSRPF